MTVSEYNDSVELYSDAIYRFVLKCVKNDEVAHNVVMDCYNNLWQNCEHLCSMNVRSYLFSIAYRGLTELLSQGARPEVSCDGMERENRYCDLNEVLHQAIEQLPDEQRLVVMLRDYEGYSYQEISEITRLTNERVKMNVFRARVYLKSYIGRIEAVI